MAVVVSLLLLAATLLVGAFLVLKKGKRITNKVPGLNELSFIYKLGLYYLGLDRFGHLPMLARLQDGLEGMSKIYKNEGIFSIELLSNKLVFLNAPHTVDIIANSKTELSKGPAYDSARQYMRDGLIPSNGDEKWKRHRKMIKPSFYNRIVNEVYLPVINKHSDKLVKIFKEAESKDYLDLSTTIDSIVFGIIMESALGTALKEHETFYRKIHHLLCQLQETWAKRVMVPFLNKKFFFEISPYGRKFKKECIEYSGFMEMVIRKKREELEVVRKESGLPVIDVDEDINRKAFLDFMIVQQMNEKDSFTDMEIIEEVNTFVTAGYDTSSVALSWAIYLIGLYPEIQDKVQAELDEIFGDNRDREMTVQDIAQMKYLEGCIKETMRLYPAVPMVGRQLKEDCPIGDEVIPKGTNVYLHYWSMHRNPDFFPNPEIFDPTRNYPEKAYMPFSAGPRNCVGQKFATLEEKIVLASVFRSSRVTSLEPRDKILYIPEIIGRPSNNLKVKISPRY